MKLEATFRLAVAKFLALTLVVIGSMAAVPPAIAQNANTGPASVADLAEGLLDAVVNISTRQNIAQDKTGPRMKAPEGSPFEDLFDEFFNERKQGQGSRRVSSLGSGFVIDTQGIIVTNNHVIEDADEIEINFANGTKLKAELVGTDPKTDLAVLKVEPVTPLTAVAFGDSRVMRIGDWVMAIGNPFGLGGSVSVGIVSARGRDIQAGPYDDFIQTDAAINRGNSGGPLFNMKGEVIGINTAIISPSGGSIGIGFAVPTEMAAGVIAQLREFGETRRGWLGVRIQPVTSDIAESLGMDNAFGALIAGVIRGGPVDDGSILAGDVITEFDGQRVDEMRDLPRIVAESPVGKAVDVKLIRKGEETTVKVTLGRLEDSEKLAGTDDADPDAENETETAFGMTFGVLTDDARVEREIADDVDGVLITDVEEGSAAERKSIKPGDVVVEIAQQGVETPKDVVTRINELRDGGRRNALLMIANPSGELRFVTIRMD